MTEIQDEPIGNGIYLSIYSWRKRTFLVAKFIQVKKTKKKTTHKVSSGLSIIYQ